MTGEKQNCKKELIRLTAEYNARTAKLKQAAKLVSEAFEIRKKEEAPVA